MFLYLSLATNIKLEASCNIRNDLDRTRFNCSHICILNLSINIERNIYIQQLRITHMAGCRHVNQIIYLVSDNLQLINDLVIVFIELITDDCLWPINKIALPL